MPWTNHILKRAAYNTSRATTLPYRHPALESCPYVCLEPDAFVFRLKEGDSVIWLFTMRSGLQAPVLATVVGFKEKSVHIEVLTRDGSTVDRYVDIRSLRGLPR